MSRKNIRSRVGIVIATHGKLSEGLISAAELICGPQNGVRTLKLELGDNPEALDEKFLEAVKAAEAGSGVLILLDLLGGTPSNRCAFLISRSSNIEAVSGVNLPMLLEVLLNREYCDLQKLTKIAEEKAREGIVNIRKKLEELKTSGGPYFSRI